MAKKRQSLDDQGLSSKPHLENGESSTSDSEELLVSQTLTILDPM